MNTWRVRLSQLGLLVIIRLVSGLVLMQVNSHNNAVRHLHYPVHETEHREVKWTFSGRPSCGNKIWIQNIWSVPESRPSCTWPLNELCFSWWSRNTGRARIGLILWVRRCQRSWAYVTYPWSYSHLVKELGSPNPAFFPLFHCVGGCWGEGSGNSIKEGHSSFLVHIRDSNTDHGPCWGQSRNQSGRVGLELGPSLWPHPPAGILSISQGLTIAGPVPHRAQGLFSKMPLGNPSLRKTFQNKPQALFWRQPWEPGRSCSGSHLSGCLFKT